MKRFEKCIIDDAIRSKLIWILVCHHNKKQLDMSCFLCYGDEENASCLMIALTTANQRTKLAKCVLSLCQNDSNKLLMSALLVLN